MDTLIREIRQFVVDHFLFGQDAGTLGNDESFLDTGIVDSTGVLQLVGFLEERYNVAVGNDELVPDNLDSVNKVSRFIHAKLQAREERHVAR